MSEVLLWITIGVLVGYVIGKIEFMNFKRKKCTHGVWWYLPTNEDGEKYIQIHIEETEMKQFILLEHDKFEHELMR